MKMDVSGIVKINGASLDISASDIVKGLSSQAEGFSFDRPVEFSGRVVNAGGILKLEGSLKTVYSVKCYRCLKDMNVTLYLDIKEDIFKSGRNTDSEVYTYDDDYIDIDRILKDNIVLNLPMKQVCSVGCRGLCPVCGNDLNVKECICTGETTGSKMEKLKDYFTAD